MDTPTDITRTGNIADDCTGFDVVGFDYIVYGAGDGKDEIGIVNSVHIGAGTDRSMFVSTARGNIAEGIFAAANQNELGYIIGQHNGTSAANFACCTDDGSFGGVEGNIHNFSGFADGFDGDVNGVAVAGGDGNVEAFGNGDTRIANDGGKSA